MASVGLARESSAVAEKELAYEYQVERLAVYGCAWIFGDRISGTRDDRQGLAHAFWLNQFLKMLIHFSG
jgi:hypothetical protein